MRNKNLLLILLTGIALLPYFLICFYALPYADDFCSAWKATEKILFSEKFLNQYLYWNGRYTSIVLSNLHPLITGNLLLYQFCLFMSLLLMVAGFLFFLNQFVKGFYTSLTVALFITLFYLCYLPDITESAYWYMGIVNYQLGNICFLLHLAFLSKLLSVEKPNKLFFIPVAVILLIISIGFNEIGASLIPFFYLLATIVSDKIKIPDRRLILLFFAIAVVASAFVIFSPGNTVRSNEFSGHFNLLHSLLYAALQTTRFISSWILSVPFIGISILVIAYADKIQRNFIKQFDYRLILFTLLFTVFTGAFIPYYATGILGQHRTINYVFFYFILLWLWFLVSLSEKFSLVQVFSFLKLGNIAFHIAIVCIIFMVFSSTGRAIIFDFSNNRFTDYKKDFVLRQAEIIAHPDSPVKPLAHVPNTFKITDTRADSTWWVNKCMKKYYTETGLELK